MMSLRIASATSQINRSALGCRWEEVLIWIGRLRYHRGIFGVSNTLSRRFGGLKYHFGVQIPVKGTRGLHTRLQGFKYQASQFSYVGQGLARFVHGITLLNTESNLNNTRPASRGQPSGLSVLKPTASPTIELALSIRKSSSQVL